MKHKLLSFILLLSALIAGTGSVWADTYNLVKNVSELSEGDVILIASGTTGSVKALGAQNSNNRAAASVTVTDGVISSIENAVELTLDAKKAYGKYTLKSSTGYLYAANSSNGKNNYLKEKNSKVYWSIEVNTSTYVATIKDSESSCNNRNWLLYNSSNTLFSCYSSGQNNVYIYKKQAEVAVTSLLVKTAPTKVCYEVGEALDMTGLVLDADGADVTSGYTMKIDGTSISNGATLSSVGKKTLTVTYGGKTVDQTISVGSATSIAVKTAPTKTSYDTGDSFDPTGMVVTATLSTGEALDPDTWIKEVTGYTIDPEDNLQPSNTYVTITYAGQTATQNITVTDVAVEGVSLNKTSTTIATGGTETLTLIFTPDNATNKAVTWESSNEGVATVENGVVTAVSAGSTTITVTTEDGGKTATCDVTVSVPVQATSVNITFNNALYGTSYTGTNAADKGPFAGTTDKIIVTVTQGSGAYMYINDTETRIYGGTTKGTVKLNAPRGYVMTEIVFNGGTVPGKWDITASTGTLEEATWTGSASEVTFSASSRSDFTTAVVTLAPTVTITTASYATYVSVHALDFTGKNIEAYIAQADGTTGVTFTRVNKVPANTGVLLYKDGGTTEEIPVLTGAAEDVTGNVFKPGTGATVASVEDDHLHNYILNQRDGVAGFYKANGQTVGTNRAYIQIDENSTPVKGFIALPGSDEETGIETMRNGENEKMSAIFDLSGRRVAKPTRGLYIVNGKKVIVK